LAEFRFGRADEPYKAEAALLQLREQIELHEVAGRERDAAFKELELFRIWAAILKLKSEIEAKRERPIKYTSYSIVDNRAHFDLAESPREELIGQARVINLERRRLISGEVENVDGRRLTLFIDRLFSDELPRAGMLTIDNEAAREAITRQRIALDDVKFDRSLRSDLRNLLVNPSTCRVPSANPEVEFVQEGLDDAKRDAVRRAIAADDILLVQGPPGTGKTTFITEIILQTLLRNPKARILLTSQTHVALDNAVERLLKHNKSYRIVRVGRGENSRIAKSVKSLLIENQIDNWRNEVIQAGTDYLEAWATAHGISKLQYEVSSVLRQTSAILRQLEQYRTQEQQLETDISDLALGDSTQDDSTQDQDIEITDTASHIEEELSKIAASVDGLEKERKKLNARLKKIEPDASELSDSGPDELDGWADTYLPDTDDNRCFKKLVETHTEWQTRLGRARDFESALIASSQVVAGTCIGVAGVRGSRDVEFDLCIVDEASKATPTEMLVPMSRARKWIIVGDSKQLPPFVDEGLRDRELLEANNLDKGTISETLFDRLEEKLPAGCRTVLNIQHRMVPQIGGLVSECFYDSELESAPKQWDPTFSSVLPRPVVWLTTARSIHRRESAAGFSFGNQCEARVIADLLQKMDRLAANTGRKWTVAVLTGYSQQKSILERTFAKDTFASLEVECNTVDAVQGREADIAIYSVTRSNEAGQLGFLAETKRLNVALSRAKQYLVLVGDHMFARAVTGENPFARIIEYIERRQTDCAIKEIKL